MPIRPLDIPFSRAPVIVRSAGGLSYVRWATFGMPHLGRYQPLLDSVFFLYPDEESARKGVNAGGTGFFVGVQSKNFPGQYVHTYAVTNWHVAVNGNPVIRVNKKSGPPEVFPFEPYEWTFRPNYHDIAVMPVFLDHRILKVSVISANHFFLTPDQIKKDEINAGEDVFMLGRFIDYDGVEANCPSMRFGNISMMEAIVPQPTGFKGPSIVVDMHSRTGYSGSPVFVYRTTGSTFGETDSLYFGHTMKLLGILWGQFPELWDIKDKPLPNINANSSPVTLEGKVISGWSGMSLVCPSADIWEVLSDQKLKDIRDTIEDQLEKRFKDNPLPQSDV